MHLHKYITRTHTMLVLCCQFYPCGEAILSYARTLYPMALPRFSTSTSTFGAYSIALTIVHPSLPMGSPSICISLYYIVLPLYLPRFLSLFHSCEVAMVSYVSPTYNYTLFVKPHHRAGNIPIPIL